MSSLSLFTFMHWRWKWQPTPVFLTGESQGRRSLVGCRLWVAQSQARLKQLSSSSSRDKLHEEIGSSYYLFHFVIVKLNSPDCANAIPRVRECLSFMCTRLVCICFYFFFFSFNVWKNFLFCFICVGKFFLMIFNCYRLIFLIPLKQVSINYVFFLRTFPFSPNFQTFDTKNHLTFLIQ